MISAGDTRENLIARLRGRSIVLVGMMGAGKTSIGKRLAAALGLAFVDADVEIETAAGMTIAEIFTRHGEAYFRDGERRVVSRLLREGQRVVATGGGAFMNAATRDRIAEYGISIWLKADAEILLRRVRKRSHRPLLSGQDAEQTMLRLIEERYPVYALADLCVESREGPHELVVADVMAALDRGLATISRLNRPVEPQPPAPIAPRLSDHGLAFETVPIEFGAKRYEAVVGSGVLGEAGARLARLAPDAVCAVVTDKSAIGGHLVALEASLASAAIRFVRIIAPECQDQDRWGAFSSICDQIVAAGVKRGDLVIGLGGEEIIDLAGFAASAIHRGMRLVRVPTTLRSQIESTVGGNVGLKSTRGTIPIGATLFPALVLVDTRTQANSPIRDLRAGYAHLVKYALIKSADDFLWLESHGRQVLERGPSISHAIAASCRAKASLLAGGEESLMDFGLAFADCLPRGGLSGGAPLNEGERLSVGMACSFRLSARLGHCDQGEAERVENHLLQSGLPTRITDAPGPAIDASALAESLLQGKEPRSLVLARGIGQCFQSGDIPADALLNFLRAELEQ